MPYSFSQRGLGPLGHLRFLCPAWALVLAPLLGGAQTPDRIPAEAVPALTVLADTIPADTVPADTLEAPVLRGGPPQVDAIPGPALVLDTLPVDAGGDTIRPIPVQELVVEILRSPMQVGETPFAVSVLAQELGTTGRSQSSIEEALQGLPGVQVHNRFNDAVGERISIRGFGARSQFGVRGIRILVDGIPATLPDGQSTLDHLDLGSLGRVEALRGPGSALYGNASGGVLSFDSRAPADAYVRQEFRRIRGDHGYERTQSTTSGQIGPVAYLANLARYEFGGYRSNPFREDGRPYGSALRDHLNAQVHAPVLGGRLRVTTNAVELDAENPGALSAELLELGDRRALPFNVEQRAGKQLRQGQAGVRWVGPMGDRELELMAYGIDRDLRNPTAADWVRLDRRAGGLRAIVRSEAQGDEGRLWWALGMDADLQSDDRRAFQNLGGTPGPPVLDQRERVLGGAVFIQAMLPINPVLDVLTGLRYDRIHFAATDHLPGPDGEAGGSGSRTLDSASPSFGVHAGILDALNLYANLTTAFETPTANELSTRPNGERGFNPDLEPQVGITTEVGGRGIISSLMAWEAVFFHTTLHNELVPFELADEPGRRYFRNSGRSQRQGWELALQFTPDPAVRARFVFSTNTARFRDFRFDDENLAGKRVPGLAPHRGEAILRLGPGAWFAELRGETTGAIQGNDRNTAEAVSPAYRLVDLRAGANEVNLLGIRLSPFLGVTNLFDQAYNTSVVVNAVGERYFEPGPGRSVYMGSSIAVQF